MCVPFYWHPQFSVNERCWGGTHREQVLAISDLQFLSYKFCQMKDLIKLYMVSFICGCEVKTFQSFSYWLSIYEMVPFGGFWALLPQILFDLAEILTRGILPIRQIQCLKNPTKFWILTQMECTQNLQFWFILGPNLLSENQKYC